MRRTMAPEGGREGRDGESDGEIYYFPKTNLNEKGERSTDSGKHVRNLVFHRHFLKRCATYKLLCLFNYPKSLTISWMFQNLVAQFWKR